MNYWLLKSEPNTWSWEDQIAKGASGEIWDGVRNHQAANFLRAMKKGDLAFFYHSGKTPRIVGVVSIIKEHFIDPSDKSNKFFAVTVKAESKITKEMLPHPVSLKAIKENPDFKDFHLVKQSRLSVMPVSVVYWKKIITLSQTSTE